MRFSASLGLAVLLAGCTTIPVAQQPRDVSPPPPEAREVPPTTPQQPEPQGFIAPQVLRMAGLENVIEQDADRLTRLFGKPRLDVREGDMRKLQFAGDACVLDVFLYPLRPGAEPVATYVDARRASDGLDVDRAACARALQK
ncbi:hypothetical protein GRI89_12920 [Altererythrobacter salegens]|uniref:Lipoprotein n=1 Tax=Croceibacterium salegens TaxID=1737568 RepID=A0A6I4SZ10_9SPHN|nr:hypothetical protein [Croceibacterium salegens]MXO60440.1 hypothetical protein [Croceibacterium salegens]